jgi:hypothetical protein
MDGIVQLDALIDENGNVAEVKPMSGPRLLQRAGERAVALWIFQPALWDGKPTATHIVLTVEFQHHIQPALRLGQTRQQQLKSPHRAAAEIGRTHLLILT